MKEEEDHQRSSAPAKMNGTKNESSLLPPVDDDWKKVIENFHRHRREKTTNINAFARRRRKHFAQKRTETIRILTVISILPAGWPPISMSKKTTGLDIF